MTIVDRFRQRVHLPRKGPERIWELIRMHFVGEDPQRWKGMTMLALRVQCGWPLDVIGRAFGHSKGHVQRLLRQFRNELQESFAPPRDWQRPGGERSESGDAPERAAGSGTDSPSRRQDVIELRRLPIEQLKPAPYNPRVTLKPGMPGYRRLDRSLAEFDLVEPIVWNERTGHVVSGHQRLEILKQRGETEVDVSVVSLPLEREKALNVVLNNPQVGGDWEFDRLAELVAELDSIPDFDATLTGFDEDDLRSLLLEPAGKPSAGDADDEQSPNVRVMLEVPPEEWDEVRPALDELLAEHELTVHVRLPRPA